MKHIIIKKSYYSFTILLLLFASQIIAQDSTSINIKNNANVELQKRDFDYLEIKQNVPKQFLELKSQRQWFPSTINQTTNGTSMLNLKKREQNFIDSDLFLIVVGSAVVFGATAAYLKFEADSYYDKYETTNNKKYKNRTDQYDLYSGIALGVMEINFGFLIYKFLTD